VAERLFRRSTSNVWYASYYDANGKRQTRSTKQLDRRAAAATLREWERRAADPAYAASNQATLEEALRGVLRDRKLKGRAEGTLDCYRVKAGHLTRILGEQLPLREVTAKTVDSFIDRRLDEGAARNTIHKELTVLRSGLKVAKRRGEFAGDIAAVMPDGFSTDYKPRERFLTAREAQALLGQLEPDRAARVAFILATGARWGESERARAQNIDMSRGLALLRGTKTKTSERFVPVVGFSVPLLEHALEHREGEAPLLFLPWSNVRRDIAAACARAGIPTCTPNDLRRTFGTWWREHEVEPHLIGFLLGHKDSRMVERVYGRMPVQSLGRALERRLPPEPQVSVNTSPASPSPDCSTCAANPGQTERHMRPRRRAEARFPAGFLVSGDGIEPPTRGFSVLCSTD
jgi:integrase